MGIIDILIIIGILLFVIVGFRDGITKKIYGIIGFWVGLLIATECMYVVGKKLVDLLDFSKEISHIIAFCALFLIVVLLENLFWRWFGLSKEEVISIKQRLGGAIIGFFQGLIGVSLLLVMLAIVSLPSQEARDSSRLYKQIFTLAPTAFDYSTSLLGGSKGFLDVLRENFKGIKLP